MVRQWYALWPDTYLSTAGGPHHQSAAPPLPYFHKYMKEDRKAAAYGWPSFGGDDVSLSLVPLREFEAAGKPEAAGAGGLGCSGGGDNDGGDGHDDGGENEPGLHPSPAAVDPSPSPAGLVPLRTGDSAISTIRFLPSSLAPSLPSYNDWTYSPCQTRKALMALKTGL